MSNPIVRWTIGPVQKAGLDCLRKSVKRFAEIYPNFDRVICFNQINKNALKDIPAFLFDQNKTINILDRQPLDGYQVHWKLYPARIFKTRHEIAIDNDIILEKQLPEIEEFLKSNKTLVYEGRHRLYGLFESRVRPELKINSGIFGIPPMFDLNFRINALIKQSEWTDKFDEQGAIAAILTSEEYIMIPQIRIPITEENESLVHNNEKCGHHFVGLNYCSTHRGWTEYLSLC